MMAVTPKAATESQRLPPELADLASPVWRDPELFTAWIRQHLRADLHPEADVLAELQVRTWPSRYTYAVQQWAVGAGTLHKGSVDAKRVRQMGGFLPVPAIVRAMVRAGQDFDSCLRMLAATHAARRALDAPSDGIVTGLAVPS